ncbi:conserved hypothetical protein [Sporisorium reilianum SRZ2]|uniref:AB hydrolase-1 domain-containing protein n=1 Tax=Sporisorium reilianum (strain SRZ2) TaxID=999809 RepID=E6ZJH0_SPORE|nr:conserved hypothetical protein [Sporisorium reilianum SRZ2]
MPRYAVPTALPIALDNGAIYLHTIVQDPPSLASASTSCRGLAVLAHPLGRLGGSLDDPVITHVASLLLTHAHLRVVRFNARGVGKSGGSPSWTGRTECSDFQEIVAKCIDNFCLDFPDSSAAQVAVLGYSAGGLYASTVTVPRGVYDLKQFRGAPRPRYILLSFPAGVTWALSLFRTRTYTEALKRLLTSTAGPGDADAAPAEDEREAKAAARAAESTPSNDAASLPVASHVLAIYGDQDQFTGVGTYETWTGECGKLAPSPLIATPHRGSTFHHVLIENADHFYRSSRALDALDKAIVEWYDALKD